MTAYTLRITLLSPLTSSAGGDWANHVDTEIARDELGLPCLPGRRIKGLLRDGLRDLADALHLCGLPCQWDGRRVDEALCGQPGAGPGQGSLLTVSTAVPTGFAPESPSRALLANLVRERVLTPLEVTGACTSIRAQTAIDPRTGSARENTLRFHRVLDSGQSFSARIHLREPALAPLLALAAGTVRGMGLSRTRGYGAVRLELLDDQGRNLTEAARSQAAEQGLDSLCPNHAQAGTSPVPRQQGKTAPTPETPPGEHLLRYRLTLLQDALLPQADTDPNSMASLSFLPGATLQGAFAARFPGIQAGQAAILANREFRSVFLAGQARFLNAYPEARDEPGMRLIPTPHSLRRKKAAPGQILDLADRMDQREPGHRMAGGFLKTGHAPGEQMVETSLQYHHARAGDRRFGRALGAEVTDGGALFTYEGLTAGQSFIAAVQGECAVLDHIRNVLPDGTTLLIGRSRTAQYGGHARLEWLDARPTAATVDRPEWNSWQPCSGPPSSDGTFLTVTCLAPLLAVNDWGHPAACFPVREMAEILGIPGDQLVLERAWARSRVTGSFHQHLRLPGQQWPAIAEGSVFVFRIEPASPEPAGLAAGLAALEQRGLGLGRDTGHGRLAVNLHGTAGRFSLSTKLPLLTFSSHENQAALASGTELDALLTSIVLERSRRELRLEAHRLVKKLGDKGAPTSSALNRVAVLLRQEDWDVRVSSEYAGFKERAKQQFRDCILFRPEEFSRSDRLEDILKCWLEDPVRLGLEVFRKRCKSGGKTSLALFFPKHDPTRLEPTQAQARELCRTFLAALFQELNHHNRTQGGQGGDQ